MSATPDKPSSHALPARIGHYLILRLLGQGGMGTVYEAEQEQPRRVVALKVMRAGFASADLVRRFERESQVLARLQHPGIAQVYEAGTFVDERGAAVPFFAMEYVRGVPLTYFAGEQHLDARRRLELVARIADAVDHAHQKGVIHRDLKPANILVDDAGQPKILDFGVARATDVDRRETALHTHAGQFIGTVPYMSPEQIGGDPRDLDARSDVYALGVIAYELLSGRLPHEVRSLPIVEAARRIQDDEPTRLSSFDRRLRGDVETIVAKALEKSKARRYPSAEALAADIRRYLSDEPITARPATTWYQVRKFSQRNQGLVGGLAAAFLALVAGVVVSVIQAVRARDAEELATQNATRANEKTRIAERERDKARTTSQFLQETLSGVGPSVALGRDTTLLREMMDLAAARIERGELAGAPEVEVLLRNSIGITYCEISAYERAESMLRPALELARSAPENAGEAGIATSLFHIGRLLVEWGKLAEAEPILREALATSMRSRGENHEEVAAELNQLGIVLMESGRPAESEPLLRQSAEIYERVLGPMHPYLARVLTNLAALREDVRDLVEAESLLARALAIERAAFGDRHPSIATDLNNLGALRRRQGDIQGGIRCLREALAMRIELNGEESTAVANTRTGLGALLHDTRAYAEAEQQYRAARAIRQKILGDAHDDTVAVTDILARVLHDQEKFAEAEPLYREVVQRTRDRSPPDEPALAARLALLGLTLLREKKFEAAEPVLAECVELREKLLPDGHPMVWTRFNSVNMLGRAVHQNARALAAADPARAASELERAERLLVDGSRGMEAAKAPLPRLREAIESVVELYETWETLEPGMGKRDKSAPWKDWLAQNPP